MRSSPTIETFSPEEIYVSERLRSVVDERVEVIAASMKEIGLRTPISVRIVDRMDIPGEGEVEGVPVLVAGAHRLAAARKLGWTEIACIELEDSDLDCQLWEIDENLARSELKPAEMALHTSRRAKLWEEKNNRGNSPKTPGRPTGFVSETARAAGKDQTTIRDAKRRGDKIAPDVLQQVRGTSLDKGVELDALAKRPVEQQRALAAEAVAGKPVTARPAINGFESIERQVDALMRAWNAAGPEAREEFMSRVDKPVFDSTKAA